MATKEISVDEAVAQADDQLGDDFEEQEVDQPEVEAATAPTTEAPDPLDAEVPVDRLPGFWKNKHLQTGQPVRYRDLVEGAQSAEEKIREQGTHANTLRDQLRVAQAANQAILEQLREMRQPAPQAPRRPSYNDVGVSDPNEEMLRDPQRFGNATAELGAQIATSQLTPQLNSALSEVGNIRQRLDLLDVRTAAETAREMLAADPKTAHIAERATWQRLGRFLYAAAGADERGPKAAEAWHQAAVDLVGTMPASEIRPQRPVEGIMRGNPSGTSRPNVMKPTTAPNKRVRGLVSSVEQEALKAGLSPERARAAAMRTEELLAKKEASN